MLLAKLEIAYVHPSSIVVFSIASETVEMCPLPHTRRKGSVKGHKAFKEKQQFLDEVISAGLSFRSIKDKIKQR